MQISSRLSTNQLGTDFPDDPKVQLFEAIKAVFRSWDNPRANIYRMDHDIPYSWGTAVNVQMMAFGNMGDTSGTGVAFTRNPATGEKGLMGEFLMNAQGEDVVAGVRTPMPIEKMKEVLPEVYEQFLGVYNTLENRYRDMQDMEFTIRIRSSTCFVETVSAIKIACDLIVGMISEGFMQIDAKSLDMLPPKVRAAALKNANPSARVSSSRSSRYHHFTVEDAVEHKEARRSPSASRPPEDTENEIQGILTVRGGQTSHAAVVARGMGTCCVSGCGDIKMDEENKRFTLAGKTYTEGDPISLDGSTGNIYDCLIPTVPADPNSGYFGRIMELADKYKRMGVRTNADTPEDAKQAAAFGAQGIGLCRTEHMFFDPSRIGAFREMICAETVEEREAALAKIEPMQQSDFEGLFEALGGYPVTIRFLDPPLHEFVPTDEADIKALAEVQGKSVEYIKQVIADLHEFNPMMGHRGCRLSVTYPEIAAMQTRAIIKAAIAVKARHADWNIVPEIMIPLVGDVKELKFVKDVVVKTADEEIAAAGTELKYEVGTMIEIPRAALTADDIAKEAEFFCFGTNDLTQMTFGFSRDDAGKFLPSYYSNKIYESDPFARLDTTGVGRLMDTAVKLGKSTRPTLHCGICGEHGGDPSSIEFCNSIGLDYVSCSPFRVPIARLAAAQAAIKEQGNK
ncbi:MAG: pyruvate, phosphate dikinase [Lachnospiraceae bacterium]